MIRCLFLIISFSVLFSCKKENALSPGTPAPNLPPQIIDNTVNFHTLLVKFKAFAGNERFSFNTEYTNSKGEKFKVNRFQYYVSNLSLTSSDGLKVNFPDTYFLITEGIKDSLYLQNVPEGNYTSISFLIGIDSTKSKEGAHSGDLDPSGNMFMAWSGYTYVALQGNYLNNPDYLPFKYIIRGYSPRQYYAVQPVTLLFNEITAIDKNKKITVKTDLLEIFKNPSGFSIKEKPEIETAGAAAYEFSLNYKDMMSLLSIE